MLPDDSAYIAFTSGSTGTPRAILGTHRPLSHFFWWYLQHFEFGPEDRFSGISGLGHDPFLRDVFTPLLLGARVCFPDQSHVGAVDLAAWVEQRGVTVMHGTPAHMELLALTASLVPQENRPQLHSLRYFFSGGDLLTTRTVQSLQAVAPGAHVVNLYGATETPQAIAYFELDKQSPAGRSEIVPLGKGIDGVQLLVLDAALEQAPPGTEGEICVRTPYLAASYLDENVLAAGRFIDDPFVSNSPARLYRTGDAGVVRDDGVVVFRRRIGSAVKIRGFRVEPAEVERELLQCSQIRHAAVLAEENSGRETKLVAYVSAFDGVAHDSTSIHVELSKMLPSYMLPSTIVWVNPWPLTPSGKVDREALLRQAHRAPISPRKVNAPRTATERRLARLWAELLRVAEVGRDDEFFALGGNSLVAAELFVRIEQMWGRRVPLAALFQNPSLAALATEIDSPVNGAPWLSIVPIQPCGQRPPLYCVHGLFGDVLTFADLANALGTDQPTFGLQARGLDGVQQPIDSVEGMAAAYVDELLAKQPQGPYHLLGFSAGGRIAYEMARQLTAQGHEVGFLGILDEPVHGAGPSQAGLHPKLLLENVVLNVPYWFGLVVGRSWPQRFKLVRERLRVLRRTTTRLLHPTRSKPADTPGTQLAQLMAESIDFEDLAYVKSWPEFRYRLVDAHLRASVTYSAPPYAGNVTVFRARRQPLMQRFEPDLGWSKVAQGTTKVVIVRGSHHVMMEPPYVIELGSRIGALLGHG
jgi:amino acid adenylation domain-containing protein